MDFFEGDKSILKLMTVMTAYICEYTKKRFNCTV